MDGWMDGYIQQESWMWNTLTETLSWIFTHWTFEALQSELSAGTRCLISHTGSLSASDGPGAVSQTQEWPEREAPGCVSLPVDHGRSAARVYRGLFSACDPSLLHHLSLDADTQLLGYLSRAPTKGCHSGLHRPPTTNPIEVPAHTHANDTLKHFSQVYYKLSERRRVKIMLKEYKLTPF